MSIVTHPPRLALLLLAFPYLLLTAGYSYLIPAWEANDELDHVANIQYEVKHFGKFVPIAYKRWHETHQPPLYYWMGAAWQCTLGIPAFKVSFPPWRAAKPENDKLVFAHKKFNEVQREQARTLHKIRLMAPILGTCTVILCYLLCRTLTFNRLYSGSAALTVGLHPKFLILSAVVTNDTLAILLGSALLFLTVAFVSRRDQDWQTCLLLSLGIGFIAGAGIITKLNLLPLITLLIPAALLFADYRWVQKGVSLLLVGLAALTVCGHWLMHNYIHYGEWLALRASSERLATILPRTLQPVHGFDIDRFLDFVPSTLFRTFWYNGSFNQLVAPFAFYAVLWFLASLCLGHAFLTQLIGKSTSCDKRLFLVWIAAFAGILAVVLIARQTMQAEGRIAFVSLSAFAVLLTSGSRLYFAQSRAPWLGFLLWPLSMLSFDAYIFMRFVWPHAQF